MNENDLQGLLAEYWNEFDNNRPIQPRIVVEQPYHIDERNRLTSKHFAGVPYEEVLEMVKGRYPEKFI